MTHDCKLYLKPWRELTLLSDYICQDGLVYTAQSGMQYTLSNIHMHVSYYLRIYNGVHTIYNCLGDPIPKLSFDAMNHICNSTKTNELEYLLNRGDKLEEHY